ncbi:MAG: hypothetical protein Q8K99_02355 [Actinomycetota bacterium]|nr:hypothetical protein [Actinomycetota bacterium]
MPKPKEDALLRDLARDCGHLSDLERSLVTQEGYLEEYTQAAGNLYLREKTLGDAVKFVSRLRRPSDSPTDLGRVKRPHDGSGKRDGRWELLADLGKAIGDEVPPPLAAEGLSMWVSRVGLGSARLVSITFDSRLSRQALFREITQMWPDLRSKGWVRPSRPLGERKLTLVRFVCLDSTPDESWRGRLDRWNKVHPNWCYRDSAAMQSDFARAEASLTGIKQGLAWYYDSAVRHFWDATDDEIKSAVESDGIGRREHDALVKVWNARRPPLRIKTEEEYRAYIKSLNGAKKKAGE